MCACAFFELTNDFLTPLLKFLYSFITKAVGMASRRRRRPDDLMNTPMLRRSPRLSSRPPIDPSTQQYSRPSLGGRQSTLVTGRKSKSRSSSPSAILNESGQSVPLTFEDARQSVDPNQREGIPRHFYGLDTDGVGAQPSEPSRLWNTYDKERVFVTSAPLTTPDFDDDTRGFCSRVMHFFTSALFKFGSFLYLAAVAILCLDVIMLHRLFNFASLSQRIGSISRFFLLVFCLAALVGVLLGGHLFVTSMGESTEWKAGHDEQQQTQPPISNSMLEEMRQSIMRSVTVKLESDMRDLESKYRREMEIYVDSIVGKSESKLSILIRDGLMSESGKNQDAIRSVEEKLLHTISETVEQRILEIKSSFGDGTRTPLSPDELEIAKRGLLDQINNLQNSQNQLSDRVQQVETKVEQRDKWSDLNTPPPSDRYDGRIGDLEHKHRMILEEMAWVKTNTLSRIEALEARNGSVPGYTMVRIFNEELEKATSDKDSALRLWLNMVFASKTDIEDINRQIEELKDHCSNIVPPPAQPLPPPPPPPQITRQEIEAMIAYALHRYGADRIAKFDFALESSGGGVMLDHCSPTFTHSVHSVSLLGVFPLWHITSTPKVIIQPSLYPGECWAMEGQSGFATIKLRDSVVVTGVTVDHIPRELSPNGTLDTAPREFSVFGLSSLDGPKVPLGSFSYDLGGTPIQQFEIEEKLSSAPFSFIRFEFLSNYGNLNYTCLYRVRVHGHFP